MEEYERNRKPQTDEVEEDPVRVMAEFFNFRAVVNFCGKPGALELLRKEPKEAVAELLAALHSAPPVVSAEEALAFSEEIQLSGDRRSIVDRGGTSDLEGYFLAKIGKHIPHLAETHSAVGGSVFSMLDSMSCLRDEVRTKLFTTAVIDAVNEVSSKRNDDSEILVVDAGTGSVPIMAIVAAFANERVRCVCFESNESSCEMARLIISEIGLGDQVTVIHGDARETATNGKKIAVLVSETMDVGLLREPMVDIFAQHSHNLSDDGVCIPSSVDLLVDVKSATDLDEGTPYAKVDERVWPLFKTLNWRAVYRWSPLDLVPKTKVNFSVAATAPDEVAVLGTRVHFPNGSTLEPGLSVITAPVMLRLKGGELNQISYSPGDDDSAVLVTPVR